jgi:cytochrome c biogenesis protein CcmG, thiol:disulfide interchange protein DsbE
MATRPRRLHRIAALAAVVLAAGAVAACGSDDDVAPGNAADAPDFSAAVEAAPPPLAELYADGDILLDGGVEGYEAQLAELEGYPVVVNKWASWCGPCREEFPYLQAQAAERADEVAFLGINSEDSEDAALTFLRNHPLPYPSFSDSDGSIASSIDAIEFPATAFYDADGELVHLRRGVYPSEQELAADIDEHARGR